MRSHVWVLRVWLGLELGLGFGFGLRIRVRQGTPQLGRYALGLSIRANEAAGCNQYHKQPSEADRAIIRVSVGVGVRDIP